MQHNYSMDSIYAMDETQASGKKMKPFIVHSLYSKGPNEM